MLAVRRKIAQLKTGEAELSGEQRAPAWQGGIPSQGKPMFPGSNSVAPPGNPGTVAGGIGRERLLPMRGMVGRQEQPGLGTPHPTTDPGKMESDPRSAGGPRWPN